MIFNGVVLAGVRKRKTSPLVPEIKINKYSIYCIFSDKRHSSLLSTQYVRNATGKTPKLMSEYDISNTDVLICWMQGRAEYFI
jgi:hypothetical protein